MDEKNIRGRLKDNKPNPIDVYVGQRMKLRRKILKMSQQTLAKHLGMTFQQVQKYEKGFSRIGASRLWDVSQVLNVSMNYFFADMDEKTMRQSPRFLNSDLKDETFLNEEVLSLDPMQRLETLKLVRAYYKLRNRKAAKMLLNTLIELTRYKSEDNEDDDIYNRP